MEPQIKAAIELLTKAGYEIKAPPKTFNEQQLRIAFNAARVPADVFCQIEIKYMYENVEEYLKSINV